MRDHPYQPTSTELYVVEGGHMRHSESLLAAVFAQVETIGPRPKTIARRLGLTKGQIDGVHRRNQDRWDAAVAQYRARLGEALSGPSIIRDTAPESESVSAPDLMPIGMSAADLARAARQALGSEPGSSTASTVEQKVTTKEQDGVIEARSEGTRIKTIQDLLEYIEADLEKYEIAMQEATKWDLGTKHPETGAITVTQLHRVFVKLRPKAGPTTEVAIQAMLDAAFRAYEPPHIQLVPKTFGDVWQTVVIADPHFGKYSWHGSTGGPNYDLTLAQTHVRSSAFELIARGNIDYEPGRRTIALLGDIAHYDTPAGTTTGGTPLDRDGRLQKMIQVATDTLIEIIEASAASVPTDVVIVPGNHDAALTWAFQRILAERFRLDDRVSIDNRFTPRKYLEHNGTLLGFAHGDKAKKRLPQLMSLEAKEAWGRAQYYEIHSGHTHAMKAEWTRPIETIDGVVVRVAPSMSPPDEWHSENGFVGSLRAMETFYYRNGGGVIGTATSSPDYTQLGTSRLRKVA